MTTWRMRVQKKRRKRKKRRKMRGDVLFFHYSKTTLCLLFVLMERKGSKGWRRVRRREEDEEKKMGSLTHLFSVSSHPGQQFGIRSFWRGIVLKMHYVLYFVMHFVLWIMNYELWHFELWHFDICIIPIWNMLFDHLELWLWQNSNFVFTQFNWCCIIFIIFQKYGPVLLCDMTYCVHIHQRNMMTCTCTCILLTNENCVHAIKGGTGSIYNKIRNVRFQSTDNVSEKFESKRFEIWDSQVGVPGYPSFLL